MRGGAGGSHYAFASQLCDTPSWPATSYSSDEPVRRHEAAAVRQGHWRLPPFDDVQQCVRRFDEARQLSGATAETGARMRMSEVFGEQTRAFLHAASNLSQLGIDGAVACAACIGDVRFRVPLCVDPAFYARQTSGNATLQLWWLGMEEYAGIMHGDPLLLPLNRHFVGALVAALTRSVGLDFGSLLRLFAGRRYYERNFLHGSIWYWFGCAPLVASDDAQEDGAAEAWAGEAWRAIVQEAPEIVDPVDDLQTLRPPWVSDGWRRSGNSSVCRADAQRLQLVHGLGHSLLYHFVRQGGPAQSAPAALRRALDACSRAPPEMHRLYATAFDHSEGGTVRENCGCGAFHGFFLDLDPSLADLPPADRASVTAWTKVCHAVLRVNGSLAKYAHYLNVCEYCGAYNTYKVLGLRWCAEYAPNRTDVRACPQSPKK
eukprot:4550721-Prymnesium_polylepis.1